ncbi:SDR family NAD(P)-dependent oxidoreductase [Sphingobacterium sp.]|uniref:SDR family NAD(P)-dependent oxidoreductase n=1 Tax=Sphingobacterium sp. TaxID=341027 RepID=UPI0028A1011E|nr:SDR family NAD(P)-dependent oxidoreductase [Sphingobacterium sp.]
MQQRLQCEAAHKLADNGSIINLSSMVTRNISPTYGVYSATKAAVEQMSRVFGKEIKTNRSLAKLGNYYFILRQIFSFPT